MECNFNPSKNTYNPHFHIIVPDRETAKLLVVEWQQKWTKKFTTFAAQHSKRIDNCQSALIEIIKYGSKIFTEPDVKKKKKSNIPPKVYADALDNILAEFKERRLLQNFGFNLPKQTEKKTAKTQVITDYEELIFDFQMNDWINTDTGELFTGYRPPPILNYLLGDIDIETS